LKIYSGWPKTKNIFNIYKPQGTRTAWNRRKCRANTLL
jgi:hypothetical protein